MSSLPTEKHYRVTRGDDRGFPLKLTKGNQYEPYNIVGESEITVRLRRQDGGVLELKMTDGKVQVTSAGAGKIQCAMSGDETKLLKVGTYQDFEVVLVANGKRSTFEFSRLLSVRDPL